MVFEPIPTNLRSLFLSTQISNFRDDSLIKFTVDPVLTRKMVCSGENAKFFNFTNAAGPKFFNSSSLRIILHSGRDLGCRSSCSRSDGPFCSLKA